MVTERSEFLAGLRAELPILLGVIPFGMIYGVLAVSVGLPPEAAFGMSVIVFAGSAQFVGAQLIGAGTPGIVVVLTTLVVNLRHMLYSASVAPHVRPLRPAWKWLLAYLLTDEAYAVTITHYLRGSNLTHKHWYFLGAGLALWGTWQTSTAVGIFLGARVPASWSLDFTLALTFIAIVVPALKDRASVASALSAGGVAVLAAGLPYKLGLMLAALTGIVVGVALETLFPSPARVAVETQGETRNP
jgi:4-azaleucine resistance transporter AzlC